MGSRRVIIALALLVAPIAARAQSEPALWRFADPNSKSVIGIDWARIRSSAAGSAIRQSLPGAGGLPGLLVLQLLDSLDRVLICSPAGPSAPGSGDNATNVGSQDTPILIAIQGRFDAGHVRQLFAGSGAKPQSYNSFQVYRPQGKNDRNHAWVQYDAHTILYGDAPLVFAALDRNEFGPPAGTASRPGSLAARAAELDAKYEIWGVIDVVDVAANNSLAALFRANEWVSAVQGMEAGLNLGAGLDADFILRFATEEAAKHAVTDLATAMTAAGKDKSAGPQAPELLKKLRFSTEGSAAKVSLHMNQQELEEAAQVFKPGVQSGQRAAANHPAAAPNPVFVPAAPPKPAVIRIEGLDEGTREIPYQKPE